MGKVDMECAGERETVRGGSGEILRVRSRKGFVNHFREDSSNPQSTRNRAGNCTKRMT